MCCDVHFDLESSYPAQLPDFTLGHKWLSFTLLNTPVYRGILNKSSSYS